MLIVDGERRYIDANHPARLAFRLSLQELRGYRIGDLTPPYLLDHLDRMWTQLLDSGCVAGPYQLAGPDGSRLDLVLCALANVLPGRHVIVFAPASWPEGELGPLEKDGRGRTVELTPRETEVLALAADGRSVQEVAEELVVGAETVNTHFKNIYAKLEVRNRAGAVAKAMRLGLID